MADGRWRVLRGCGAWCVDITDWLQGIWDMGAWLMVAMTSGVLSAVFIIYLQLQFHERISFSISALSPW
jgi:hypothetical protein